MSARVLIGKKSVNHMLFTRESIRHYSHIGDMQCQSVSLCSFDQSSYRIGIDSIRPIDIHVGVFDFFKCTCFEAIVEKSVFLIFSIIEKEARSRIDKIVLIIRSEMPGKKVKAVSLKQRIVRKYKRIENGLPRGDHRSIEKIEVTQRSEKLFIMIEKQ